MFLNILFFLSFQIFQGCGRPQTSQLGRLKRALKSPAETLTSSETSSHPREPVMDASADQGGQPTDAEIASSLADLQRQFGGNLNGLDLSKVAGLNPKKNKTTTSTYEYNAPKTKKQRKQPTAQGSSLDHLVKDIKDRIGLIKDFWVRLPYSICIDERYAAAAENEAECWNGQDRARWVSL